MVQCFAVGCSHAAERGDPCRFFRFREKTLAKWTRLCRRADRKPTTESRLCSCHFKDGDVENGPTIFEYNSQTRFDFPELPLRRKVATPKTPATTPKKSELVKKRKCESDETFVDIQATVKRIKSDHSYANPCTEERCSKRIEELSTELEKLQAELADLKEIQIKERNQATGLYEEIKNSSDKMISFTSLQLDVFDILVSMLSRFKISYVKNWTVRSLSMHDQVLLTLMKLKLNLRDFDLAHRFQISKTTVSVIFKTFVHALHELLIEGIMDSEKGVPSAAKCAESLPKCFEGFNSARLVMDATEITQDIPSDLNENRVSYSSYKGRHTLKSLTCVAPNATLVYASPFYPGSTSDTAIVRHSKILDKLVPGDLVIADKGFPIYDQLPPGVHLNIPPFLTAKSQFTESEATMAVKIARARIHVERANERIKNFAILGHIPAQYRALSSKIFQVCSYLINLQSPLLKEIANKHSGQ